MSTFLKTVDITVTSMSSTGFRLHVDCPSSHELIDCEFLSFEPKLQERTVRIKGSRREYQGYRQLQLALVTHLNHQGGR